MKTWVKLKTKINHDPEVGTLSWAHRGIWCALLALAGEIDDRDGDDRETGRLDTPENTAWRIRCDWSEFQAALAEFLKRGGWIEERDGVLYLTKYRESQERPPSSRRKAVAERVQRTRARKAQRCNEGVTTLHAHVTPLDTESESDTETESETESIGAGTPAPTQKPRITDGERRKQDAVRLALQRHFCERTKIKPPETNTDKQKRGAGALWWGPLREIAELAEWDVKGGQEIIDAAVLRLDGLTISDPKSILRTAYAIVAEAERPRLSSVGGTGGPMGRHDARASPGSENLRRLEEWARQEGVLDGVKN